ncbi:unnamed protein product [Hymenolepis diminuta]|uniref:26S proteasome non-ATPase regulatory subunit 5 n=1 Tax=Hymenolepis diminuta TaxID=6216 RepID=A0A0R3SHW9_HYMDI|nr:unnamed protein product [Hymenolepis diminuta]
MSFDAHLATIMTINVDKKVMDLLSKSQDVNVQIAATKAMAIFLRSGPIRISVTASGGLSEFVHMYNSENSEFHEAALSALNNLVKDNTVACRELGQTPDFISQLIGSLKGSECVALFTLDIIQEFTKDDALRNKLYEFDIIQKIIEMSTSAFLKSTCFEVRKAAIISIGLLAENEFMADILYKRGVLEHLYLIQSLGDQCSGYVEIAIKHILDANLVLKFAMTGILDYSDITGDVFYDFGPIKTSEHLKILQTYANEPLNNSPPIWLLNITEVGTLDSDGFQLPYDTELRTFIKSSTAKIIETSDFKTKIRILAVEVVDYFGGPMTREEAYSSIDWQEITKYRCHLNTNIVPIGLPERAGYRHRALLFKVRVYFNYLHI